jgi:hypothetical protein
VTAIKSFLSDADSKIATSHSSNAIAPDAEVDVEVARQAEIEIEMVCASGTPAGEL